MRLRQAVIGDIEAISHIESLCFPEAEASRLMSSLKNALMPSQRTFLY